MTEVTLNDKDYTEISTKFKASHVKIMVFWCARKTQRAADASPQDIVLQALSTCCYSVQQCVALLESSGILLEDSVATEAAVAITPPVLRMAVIVFLQQTNDDFQNEAQGPLPVPPI